jgi:probable phosphoglycerate mutase
VIWLARHGETDWNVSPPRFMGSVDIPLNDRGREQAHALAAEVDGIAAVWSSPLLRARETAEIVAAEYGLEVWVDDRLAESRRGAWEGRPIPEIAEQEPDAWAAWRLGGAEFRFPGGESLGEHAARTAEALARVATGPVPALVVCHGGTIRCAVALQHERGLDAFHELEVPNAHVVRLDGSG